MLPIYALVISSVVALIAGFLVGMIGVGGVIIVPIILQIPDINVQMAIAAAMISYNATGLCCIIMYSRKNTIDWKNIVSVVISAAPAAFLGSYLLKAVSDVVAKLILYGFVLISSLPSLIRTIRNRYNRNELRSHKCRSNEIAMFTSSDTLNSKEDETPKQNIELTNVSNVSSCDTTKSLPFGLGSTKKTEIFRVFIGIFIGLVSAITGTGGPVVSMPLTLLLKWPIRVALGVGQVIQLPVALASTLSYIFLRREQIHIDLVIAIVIGLVPSCIIGTIISDKVPEFGLQVTVLSILVGGSIFLIINTAII